MRYIDSPVLRDRDADGNAATGDLGAAASGMEQRVYYLTDGNFNVTALAGTDGAILERYAYDAYGNPRFYAADWSARSQSSTPTPSSSAATSATPIPASTTSTAVRTARPVLTLWSSPLIGV